MATVKSPPWVPDRRDMIWIDCSPQVGVEMKDEHPMLVLSTKAFNERTGIVIGLPMTHAQSNETNPFAIKYIGPKNEVGYVLTHQPKSFDWRQRGARAHPWKQVTPALFQDACDELNSIISICV
jgi:mRNA interferase MazF